MPVVALVGRPNVGKSTIFNRIVGKKIAIIEDTPGVTRDRVYSKASYYDYKFHLIDTGGVELGNADFNTEIKAQVELAIDEADIVIFVVDGKEGLTSDDLLVRDMLKKVSNKVVVAINKCDNKKINDNEYEFYELGFSNYVKVSGEHGTGISDLLDIVTKDFNRYEEEDNTKIKFSIIGRPNVGKSSLVNALLNEDRVIVSNIAGTTRDSIDTEFNYNNEKYVVIDTAGMRKKGRIYESVEKYSFLRSLKAIDRSDVCVLVIDAETGIVEHDKHIAGYAIDAGKPIVLVVNKWDTIDNKDSAIKEWKDNISKNFAFLSYAKVVFLSAKTKKRIHTLMPEILSAYENSKREVKTSLLNKVINDAYLLNLPPSYKGKRLKIYFANQTGICPPTFNIGVNSKGLVHFSYERYLENKIRESFDFTGTPIIINFKGKKED